MSQNVWATIMPFGPVTNFLLALISGTEYGEIRSPMVLKYQKTGKGP